MAQPITGAPSAWLINRSTVTVGVIRAGAQPRWPSPVKCHLQRRGRP